VLQRAARATPAHARGQKRFDTALECLQGLGVPVTGAEHAATHVLCCADEWPPLQKARQCALTVIDAMQFSLDPPHALYRMLLP
jgi:hypothetical protein